MKTVIIEDQGLVRGFLRGLVERTDGLTLEGEAADGNQAWGLMEKVQPDLVILDLELPGIDGLSLARHLRENYPRCALLVVTSHREPWVEDQVRDLEPEGWVDKWVPPERLAAVL